MDMLFFAAIVMYFAATMLQSVGAMMDKENLTRAARAVFAAGYFTADGERIYYCHACGGAVKQDTAFCTHCGTKLK